MNLVGGLEHVLFFHILGIIFPIDELISFQSGRSTTNQEFMLASTKLPQQIPWHNDPLQGHPKRLPRSQQWSQRMAVTGASIYLGMWLMWPSGKLTELWKSTPEIMTCRHFLKMVDVHGFFVAMFV